MNSLSNHDRNFAEQVRYTVSHPDWDGASSTVAMSNSLEAALYDALHLRKPRHDWSMNIVYDNLRKVSLFFIYEKGPDDCRHREGPHPLCEDLNKEEFWLEWIGQE